MKLRTSLGLLLCSGRLVLSQLHHLIVGGFGSDQLYTVEFNEHDSSLTLLNNITAGSDAHFWIALDHRKRNLYTTSVTSWSSYALKDLNSIQHTASLPIAGNCTGSKSIFVTSLNTAPYTVYGSTFGGNASCGQAMSVDHDGALQKTVQAFNYGPGSGVHGLAVGSNNAVLYSADDSGNAIWTHHIHPEQGTLAPVNRTPGPQLGSDPRHITVYPSGRHAYVVLEGTNKLAEYNINLVTGTLSLTNVSYSLILDGLSNDKYWSDEVKLSFSSSYLWATSRAHQSDQVGYISAFTLSESGSIDSQLFLLPTASSGGSANAVTPSDFSDQYVVLTDSETGFLQVWRFDGKTAEVAATLALEDGGCCANAVWYD